MDAHAPSLATLQQWVGELRYDPGPWRASWITRGTREIIQLEDIVLETGTEQTLIARIEGKIEKVANSSKIGLESVSGIDLILKASTPDSAYLAELTGLRVPPYHALQAQLQVSGSGNELVLRNGTLRVNSSDLQATVSDISGSYRPDQAPTAFGDLAAEIEVTVDDTAILSQYTDLEVPFLGPAEMKASLRQSGTRFRMEPLVIRITGEELALTATGVVEDLRHMGGVRLQNRIERLDIDQLLSFAMDTFQYDGELDYLQGSFELAESEGTWRASNLVLETPETDGAKPLRISVRGDVNDLSGFTTADLEAELMVRDTALLQALTGLRARPVTAHVKVATNPERVDITARGRAGDTQLATDIQVGYRADGVSHLTARLSTPHLYLVDLGLQAIEEGGDIYAPGAGIETGARTGLESLLEKSPRFPTDIQVTVDGITGRATNIDSLDIHVTGQDNRYTLRRFSLVYDAATAELRGVIDLNSNPPFASVGGEALGIPLSTLSQDLGAPSDIRGTLTARGGVAASGVDIPSLVASLNGSLAIALEDTVIQGAAYDVLATDLLAWIYSGAALESSTHLDCTMARFDIRDGIAHTDSLYVETARMIATGKGTLDLSRRKMDLTVTPRSRSRNFQIPSEIRLRGDMSDPRPTISPISAAADASAQALLLVPKLAMRLFGAGRGQSQKGIKPCQATLD